MTSFAEIDEAFGTSLVGNVYTDLKKRIECSADEKNSEILWRLAKCCHELANNATEKSKRRDLLFEGKQFAETAVQLNEESFEALQWAAVLTGSVTDYMGTKEKIETGAKFKEYLDRALVMDERDDSLLHMRGRYYFSVAGLSWLERKAATVFFSKPPTATYDDALKDFLAAFELHSDWLENLVYIAQCYMEMKDKANAKRFLLMAVEQEIETSADMELAEEAKKMLIKC